MRGTFYINSGNIGSPNPYFMTWAAGRRARRRRPRDRRAHARPQAAHRPDRREQRREICDDATALRGRGYTITDFAYPYGAGSTAPAVRTALHDCGYTSARKVGELRSDTDCGDLSRRRDAAAGEPVRRSGAESASATGPITLADLQGWVTQAETNGGGWVPLVFHDICDNCARRLRQPVGLLRLPRLAVARAATRARS